MNKDTKKAVLELQHIGINRAMSALHPRFVAFQEAFAALVREGQVSKEEVDYFAFCYAEELGRRRG